MALAGEVETVANDFSEDPGASHARAEMGIVLLTAAHIAHAAHDARGLQRFVPRRRTCRSLPAMGVHCGDEPPEPVVGVADLLRQDRSAPEQQDQPGHEANYSSRATHAVSWARS